MILKKDQLPASPRGHRILVRPAPPIQESEIIIKPEAYQYLPNKGTLIAAGLTALDQLTDAGDRIGDEIWWGKFAGVIEEWDHVVSDGRPGCDHTWVAAPCNHPKNRRWTCAENGCAGERLAEHMLVMNADDILANVSLQRRIESGAVSVVRGKTIDGRTQHVIERKDQ